MSEIQLQRVAELLRAARFAPDATVAEMREAFGAPPPSDEQGAQPLGARRFRGPSHFRSWPDPDPGPGFTPPPIYRYPHVAFFDGICVSWPIDENGAVITFWLKPLLPTLATSYTRMPPVPSATNRYSPRNCTQLAVPDEMA